MASEGGKCVRNASQLYGALARVHLHMHDDPTSVILEADDDLSMVSCYSNGYGK